MAETLTTKFTGQLVANLSNVTPVQTVLATPSMTLDFAFAAGVGASQADQVWTDQRTLAAGTSENINVQTCNGTNDGAGLPLSFSRVKFFGVQNASAVDSTGTNFPPKLLVGGEGSSGAWNTPWNGSKTAQTVLAAGASFALIDPSPYESSTGTNTNGWSRSAYTVGLSAGTLCKFTNSGTQALTYNLLLVGTSL